MPVTPTGGFQLQRLPEPLSIPSNIGRIDVPELQQAFRGGMQNVQAARLVGPQTKAALAQAEFQAGKAQQLSRLLDPEEKAALASFNAQRLKSGREADILRATQQFYEPGSALNIPALQAAADAQEAERRKAYLDLVTGAVGGRIIQTSPAGMAAPAAAPAPQAVTMPALRGEPAPEAVTMPAQQGALPSATPMGISGVAPVAAAPSLSSFRQGQAPVDAAPAARNIVAQWEASGYRREGPTTWVKIDPVNMQTMTRRITPEGAIEDTVGPLPQGMQKEIENAQSAVELANFFDPNFEPSDPRSYRQTIKEASSVYAAPKLSNPNHTGTAINRAAGLGSNPIEARKKINEAMVAGSNTMAVMTGMDQDMQSLRGLLNEFKERNARTATGKIQAKLVDSFLAAGKGAVDFAKDITDKEQRQEFESKIQDLERMRQLHNEIVPAAIRSVANKVDGLKTSGGPSGLGRIMQNELGWLASSSPDSSNLRSTNIAIIDDALLRMDRVRDQIDYTAQFFDDFKTVDGAAENFLKYARSNPYHLPDGSANNKRKPWTEVLMSKEWNQNNPPSEVPQYAPRFADTNQQDDQAAFIAQYIQQNVNATQEEAYAAYKAQSGKK